MLNRRELLQLGLGAATLTATGRAHAGASAPKTLLILGGTGFIGPHLTDHALQRGWTVTHFNRGRRAADGVAGVETLHGDRKGQLDALRGRKWDAVVDNTGYIPKYVKESAELLAPNTGYCLFISSISAYASFARPNTVLLTGTNHAACTPTSAPSSMSCAARHAIWLRLSGFICRLPPRRRGSRTRPRPAPGPIRAAPPSPRALRPR